MSDQILSEFLAETEDLLEVLFGDLQALRVRRSEGRARRELVGRIFRHVHTVKGSSATVELNSMTRIAHEFESLLDGVRLGRVPVDDAVMDALDDAAAALSQCLERAARGEAEAQDQTLVERLRGLAKTEDGDRRRPAVRLALAALPEDVTRSLNEHEAHRLQESIEEGARAFAVTAHFELATFDERFRNLSDALAEDGEIISTLPGLEGATPDQISFRIIYAAHAGRQELASRTSAFGQVSITELVAPQDEASGEEGDEGEAAGAEARPARPAAPFSTRVRVELGELDEVISAAHEVLARATGALGLASAPGQHELGRAELAERVGEVRGRLVELEEKLIGLRMVPVAQMLERAARAGRIAARMTGKQINFEVHGGDVRLDKSLADAMADPLLHILRNAVDHGVETPAERRAAGKSERATVRLWATTEGSRVVLKVADDGRGLDALRVTRAAAERGIIEPGTVLTKEQAVRLIFRPGFSTASSVSSVSGRGVGLDVVERAIELVGGALRVASEDGAGMTFVMSLPTTLALTPALVVTSAGQRYCVDERHISETGFVTAGDISRSGGIEWLHWRGAMVPLWRARQLLAQPPREEADGESLAVIIARAGGAESEADAKPAALAVDAFGERTEALVRGLGRHAARWGGISGATELPDGTVALVLDLPRLLAR
ncbi:MAG TPA: ATP-binding protein [Pyrinomonadaceae bacterium]|jgi:two-component system chemotaxis sensor kinase CheA